VADAFAGRKARCPECKAVYTVPSADAPLLDNWRMRGEDGSVYGPVPKSELDQWVREGRVTAKCDLQREGTDQWQPASELYAALASPTSGSGTPFAEHRPPTPQPFPVTPRSPGRGARPHARQPHRGGAILALGIVGLLCCQILCPVAWLMGRSDLQAMDAGRMHPDGRALTQAGTVLGIVGTIILLLWVAANFLAIVGQAL
jgi:hypothetical protein